MKLFKKREKNNSDKCLHNLDYGICEICPIMGGWSPTDKISKEPAKKNVSSKLIRLYEGFNSDLSAIHDGNAPDWKSFFLVAKKIESQWENLISEFGECAQFSSQVMDASNLISVEWIFKNSEFVNGTIDLIGVDNHFACWLLTGKHNALLNSKNLAKIFSRLSSSEEGGYCEECKYGWWDQPMTYLATHVNCDSLTLEKIYTQNQQNLEVLCAVAQNKNTPKQILSKLSLVDEFAQYADEKICPFFDSKDSDCFKISKQAKKTLHHLSK